MSALLATKKKNDEAGLALKGVWYGAELLGKMIGQKAADTEENAMAEGREWTWPEVVASLEEDYEMKYFIRGNGSMSCYLDDCEFADPFVSFKVRA